LPDIVTECQQRAILDQDGPIDSKGGQCRLTGQRGVGRRTVLPDDGLENTLEIIRATADAFELPPSGR
jgi:hypothetical protein